MKKVSFAEFGGPDVLRLMEAEERTRGAVRYASPCGRRA